mmetsp:Transcript_16/g.34  ORF Transcript_16/g.34 Transcript_16/m.34 type:complete len:220 (-) Transcript_16:64-723(-)|eukprot:scaffold425_cov175-Amphora_coffeaeformis.AAC.25
MSTANIPASAKSDPSSSDFRCTGGDVNLFSMIPWSIVFEFSGGEGAARAMMTSRDSSPWKPAHIEHAMKERLSASDAGKGLLTHYRETPTLLPKLVYCWDNNFSYKVDGVYQSSLAGLGFPVTLKEYLRFYSDGTVITAISSQTPDEISEWFRREHVGISPGICATEIARNGVALLNLSFEIPLPPPNGAILYNGYIKPDGGICLTSTRGERRYQFVRW